ncbi:unnamed protein product [Trichogramma brassicae]|uniref:Uncharacterized protein n=1 Tax=Trichogramma brassicae TaxID=86971 RepID=A0A6H5IU88_9HYME|nr:unnamed protein product [Trichogramma brassicae]
MNEEARRLAHGVQTLGLQLNPDKTKGPAYLAGHLSFVRRDAPGSLRRSHLELKIQWAATSSLRNAFFVHTAKLHSTGASYVTKTVQNIETADCSPAPEHPQQLADDCDAQMRQMYEEHRERILSVQCHNCLHPGCAAPYLRKEGMKPCCIRTFSAIVEQVSSDDLVESSMASMVTKAASATSRNAALDRARGIEGCEGVAAHTIGSFVPVRLPLVMSAQLVAPDQALPPWLAEFTGSIKAQLEAQATELKEMKSQIDSKLDEIKSQAEAQHIELNSKLARFESSIAQLTARVEARKHKSVESAAALDKMKTEIEEVKVFTEAIKSNTTLSHSNSHLVDSCEVLLSGIPTGVDLPKDVVLKKVLTAMGLNDFERFIVNSRKWVPNKRTNSTPEAFQAIVYRCSSPSNHDFLIMNASKLALIHTNTLFGCGGDHKLVLHALWPRETYSLLSKANIAAHKIGFARPIVRNLVVHMRKITQSQLLPLATQKDLDLLIAQNQ